MKEEKFIPITEFRGNIEDVINTLKNYQEQGYTEIVQITDPYIDAILQ